MSTTETTREATRVRTLGDCLDETNEADLEGLEELRKIRFGFAFGKEGYYTVVNVGETGPIPKLSILFYNPKISPDGPIETVVRLDKHLEDKEYFPL